MIIDAVASGSKGNAYYISDGHTQLLIECGVAMKRLTKNPAFEFEDIDGILVSHRHIDHCKAVERCRDAGAEIYAPADVFEFKGMSGKGCHPVKPFGGFDIGTMYILPFDLYHDCENYGYLVCSRASNERLLYFSDTYMVRYKFNDLTYIMAECNYSGKILKDNVKIGLVPAWLKDRIKVSHMSIEQLLKFFKANDLSKVKKIYLIHMSENNGSPAVFKHKVKKATGKAVEVLG